MALIANGNVLTSRNRWQERLGLIPPKKVTPAMLRGKELEPVARKCFIEETGIENIDVPDWPGRRAVRQ